MIQRPRELAGVFCQHFGMNDELLACRTGRKWMPAVNRKKAANSGFHLFAAN